MKQKGVLLMLYRRELNRALAILATPAILRPDRAQATGTVLFKQPSLNNGIAPNFSVSNQYPAYNPVGVFYLHSNQGNPYRADHRFVPVGWDAGSYTGLEVSPMRYFNQMGIWVPSPGNASIGTGVGHTAAQVDGGRVGAYLNSRDLFTGSPGMRMMISPGYQFATTVTPFSAPGAVIAASVDLQVPSATNVPSHNLSNCYAKLDWLFMHVRNGARVSVSTGLFSNGGTPSQDGSGFDTLTNTAIADAFCAPFSQLVTIGAGSEAFQSQTWRGLRTFRYTMSQDQFAAALAAAAPLAAAHGYTLPVEPDQYAIASLHLNAELHYTHNKPATLGWSMANLQLTQVS